MSVPPDPASRAVASPPPAEVAAGFDRHAAPLRDRLLALRALVFDTAASRPEIGPLLESLKWGEPSYTPERRRVGSSVRLGARTDGSVALCFICHTNLVETFRGLYSDDLCFEGNRAIICAPDAPLAAEPLGHCIALALTWHLRSR
ncbi:uncharacterized protein DUF1801 [Hoeflea marina]|uniref:Uncharacterized protein DUF1801 n=1 Tax=Hoeflea marina TaxID=274592 RepID=A0A317PRR7_9HYPH|nr:DUF1801 domain-containing protein [Hoeflea marina]PWW01584.1 uncharacterized protein DUF1801 [Hoeflea marina]